MSGFELDGGALLGEEVRRILAAQTVAAVAGLSGPDLVTGVHEARKACKRCRAVLRLVRSGIKAKTWRELDRGYGAAARAIGPLRDAHVTPKTVRSVAGRVPGLAWKVPATPAQPERAIARAVQRLERALGLVQAIGLDPVDVDAMIDGLQRSWNDARSAMAEARDDLDPEVVHDWRKTTKRVFYNVQLLAGVWPPVVGAFVGELDALQETLGAHHDLAVVAAVVDRENTPPEALAHLDAKLHARAAELRVEALARGRLIFAPTPKTVGALVHALWAARG